MNYGRDLVFGGLFALAFLAGMLWVVSMFGDSAEAQSLTTYGREIPAEIEFERHVNIFESGDTVTCMTARDFSGMAIDCDWGKE